MIRNNFSADAPHNQRDDLDTSGVVAVYAVIASLVIVATGCWWLFR